MRKSTHADIRFLLAIGGVALVLAFALAVSARAYVFVVRARYELSARTSRAYETLGYDIRRGPNR